jgi:predicted RNA-binding protein (virulence factor B family)
MAEIGRHNTLKVLRNSMRGLYLDAGEHGEVLLPNRYVPPGVGPGDSLPVFLFRDSEDRLVASTESPRAVVGDVATLRVVAVHPKMGAFLDWGLPKDLLLPFREQTEPVRVGQDVLVRVYLDPKSQRIVASMRLNRDSALEPPDYQEGQSVDVIVTGKTPLGYKALVEGKHQGMLYRDALASPVTTGQRLKAFVRQVRPDGKIDLRLDQAGYRRVPSLALQIVNALEQAGGRLAFDDNSPPEAIRQAFSASKKAFKQALGTLYKSRRIRFTEPGIELLDNTTWSPSGDAPAAKPPGELRPRTRPAEAPISRKPRERR